MFSVAAFCQPPDSGSSGELTFHQLEWQRSTGADALAWDADGWLGTARNRIWIRDEGGRHVDGVPVDNRLELLWGHTAKYWEWLVGVRQDDGTAPSRTYFAIGIRADIPFGIRIESTGYLGDGKRAGGELHAGFRLMAEREWPLSGRLTLNMRGELEIWNEDHVRLSEGHGPMGASASLRLRYAMSPAVAPYVGVEWFELLQDTGDQARQLGETVRETRFVAGVRMRFGRP